MACLTSLYDRGALVFSASCAHLRSPGCFQELKDNLYGKDWCPYIKETFNGFGNAIEYLGRYAHKIAISNSRILSITQDSVTFPQGGSHPAARNVRSRSAMRNSSAVT